MSTSAIGSPVSRNQGENRDYPPQRLRVLIVEDSPMYRQVIRGVLLRHPDIEVVGVAADGQTAWDLIPLVQPDLLTLDLEMPGWGGLKVLEELKQSGLDVGAIVLSAASADGACDTLEALRLGAFDFVLKPVGSTREESQVILREKLFSRIDLFREQRRQRYHQTTQSWDTAQTFELDPPPIPRGSSSGRIEMVAIGASTGGPAALREVLVHLPADFPVPVVVVQHMPPLFTKSLAADLDQFCEIPIREASEGEFLLPGTVYLAPGGRQMKIKRRGSETAQVELTGEVHPGNCRPSVDFLFRSVAQRYGPRTLGVVLTGMGQDGLRGCRWIRHERGTILAQSAASCVVYGMPRVVVEHGLATQVVSLAEMGAAIVERVTPGALPAGRACQ